MMGVKACGLRLLDKSTGEMVLKAVYGLNILQNACDVY